MAVDGGAPDPRFRQLTDEMAELTRRVDLLSRRVDALTAARREEVAAWPPPEPPGDARAPASDAGRLSTILTSSAAVSFLLVIALVLRTIVDSGAIDRTVGTWLGLAYAGLVLGLGHRRHAAGVRQAPVYSTCGALLLLSIAVEGHARFATLSAETAYAVLAATMVALSATGFWFRSPVPLVVGSLGVSLVALALDFPHPAFAMLMPLLLLANVIAHAARTLPTCAWLQWPVFGTSMVVWSLWATQLRAFRLRQEPLPPGAAIDWFLPAVGAFALTYLACALWSFQRDRRAAAWFAPFVVVANVVWSFGATALVTGPWWGEQRAVAVVALALAGGHALGAAAFAPAAPPNLAAVLSLTWAALLLLAMALPALASHALAVVIWAAVATGLGVAAARTGIGALRGTAYLYQGFALVMAIAFGMMTPTAAQPAPHIASLAGASALALAHYLVCRRRLAAGDVARLRLRPEDRLGVLPLGLGLVYLFAALRAVLHAWLPPEMAEAGFQSAQSILINAMAVAVMTIGSLRRNGELFVVALAIGALGALRVFGYDLLTIQGLPLVWAVLSFGLATAAGSLLWRRWQRSAMRATDPAASGTR